MDFISITRIWVQLLFNIRWLMYYLWWSIANRNSHFSFLHHMSEANASYLEWNGKCFIAEWNGLPRRNEMKTGAASSSGVFYEAFCGDAAKYEAHLAMHEAALRAMKQSLTASFAIFCQFGQKKWRRGREFSTSHCQAQKQIFYPQSPSTLALYSTSFPESRNQQNGEKMGKASFYGGKVKKSVVCRSANLQTGNHTIIPTDSKTVEYSIKQQNFNLNGEYSGMFSA